MLFPAIQFAQLKAFEYAPINCKWNEWKDIRLMDMISNIRNEIVIHNITSNNIRKQLR